ncbi:MAG: hypothetical protein AAB225_17630 [Acidobacteriota bacterium]
MTQLRVLPPRTASRRDFLAGCAGCAALAACPGFAHAPQAPASEKARVRLVFTHPGRKIEGWPYLGYDYETRKKELTSRLTTACPNVELLPVTAPAAEDARKVLEGDGEVDGYVVYILGIPSGGARPILASGRPVVLVDDLYGGTGQFLGAYAEARRKNLRVAGVSSTRFEDVAQAVKSFEVIKRLRSSVILDVLDREPGGEAKAIQEVFGTAVRKVTSQELNDAYRKVDQAEAQRSAQSWIKGAKKIIEPSREEIGRSGVMYVAMRDLMKQHNAQAIAMDCLRLFYDGKLPAYPCLGFFQLNNDGLVGACEADLQSTISMLLMTYLAGRPGFISDPVIDTARNQVIYAHCVAPTKVYGPNGPGSPYHIRNHSEDRKGAAVRALLPLGEMTTTLKFAPSRKEVILHQGRTVANIDEDKACRTKLAVEVRDIHKLFDEWDRWGWHRVTYYGDLRQPVEAISALLGFKLVAEG